MSRAQISLLVIVVMVGLAVARGLAGENVGWSHFVPFSTVVTISVICWAVFDKWAWRTPLLRKLWPRPDLAGTWKGTLASSWVDPSTGKPRPPIKAFVAITQTFLSVNMRVFTADARSSTVASSILHDGDDQFVLTTVYRGEPKLGVRTGSPIHYGGTVLRASGERPSNLSGHYWTDRGTQGEMIFERLEGRTIEDFADGELLASVTG